MKNCKNVKNRTVKAVKTYRKPEVGKNVKNEKPMRIQDKNIGKYREKSEN